MRKPPFTSEQELAGIVVEWLQHHHWEVYQEVPVGSGIADIVAKQGRILWLIETKLSMSLNLINQLDDRIGYANFTSAAIPSRVRKAPHKLLKALGAGCLTVYQRGFGGRPYLTETVHPRFFRKTRGIELYEEQKTFCSAGSPSGGHWTPFKETSRNVQGYVFSHPGCTMKEMLGNIKYHYGTPAAAHTCIVRWIEGNVIKGIRIDRGERSLRLFPKEEVL